MTIAFRKLLHCIVLIRACLFARGRFIYDWMKGCFFIHYKCCIDTRFSKCSSEQFAGFTVCEKFPSLLHYLSLSILSIHRSILRSCDRNFVFRFWCRSRRCHRYKEQGTFKSQIFVSGILEIFPKKSSPRQIIFISIKALEKPYKEICCSFFEALSILWKFSAELFTIQLNPIENDYCKLKKKASALRPLGLLFFEINGYFAKTTIQWLLSCPSLSTINNKWANFLATESNIITFELHISSTLVSVVYLHDLFHARYHHVQSVSLR